MIRFHFTHDWGKRVWHLRNFELLPSISINLYEKWKFESVRFNWLGVMFGIYIETK